MANDIVYEKILRPLLFAVDPEQAHHFAQYILQLAEPLLPALGLRYNKNDLACQHLGVRFENPIGLAAGFDKNARLISAYNALGFGFAEIGSVCARPHGGNPTPRLFRLAEDRALINRLGLNTLGAEMIALGLAKYSSGFPLPAGVNIAKTNDPKICGEAAIEDVLYSFEKMQNFPFKYATLNCSCPNTSEGCLKESQELGKLLEQIRSVNQNKLPILLKLSPDSTDDFIKETARIGNDFDIAGYVCGNTTLKRDGLRADASRLSEIGAGGLSGSPLKAHNLALTKKLSKLKNPKQIIIGVGGIVNGQDAFDYLKAGASLLQIYTGFVYRGPSTVKQICQELSALLAQNGLSLQELCAQNGLGLQNSALKTD